MIIDWKEYEDKEHLLAWLLVETMADYGIEKFGNFDSGVLDVRLVVNGIDVDLLKAVNNANNQLDDIKNKAILEGKRLAAQDIGDSVTLLVDGLVDSYYD